MEGFTYKGYEYEHIEMEDCILSRALFLFDKDGEEYYVESPGYPSNMPGYYNLKDCTPRVGVAIKNGMDIDEAFSRYYKFYTVWGIDD